MCDAGEPAGLTSGDSVAHTVSATGPAARLELRGLTLRDNLHAAQGATVSLRGVRVVGPHEYCLSVEGAGSSIDAEDTVLDHPALASRSGAEGMVVLDRARASLRRSVVVGTVRTGIAASEGGTLTLEDVAVRDVTPSPEGYGDGVYVEDATLTVRGLHVAQVAKAGIEVSGRARATIDAVRVDGVAATADDRNGIGLVAVNAASLDATRVWIAGARGLAAANLGATLTLADAVFVTLIPDREAVVSAVVARDRSRVSVRRTRIEHALGMGGYATASELSLEDVAIVGVAPPTDLSAVGLMVTDGAQLVASRIRVEDVLGMSLVAFTPNTRVSLVDAVFSSAAGLAASPYMSGVFIDDGASVTASRLALVRARGAGITVRYGDGGAARAQIDDLFVRDVILARTLGAEDVISPPLAYGLYVARGCTLETRRAVLDGGGWGYVSTLGALHLHEALVRGQRDGVGAVNGQGPTTALTLDRVTSIENARDEIVRDTMLPEVRFAPPRLDL